MFNSDTVERIISLQGKSYRLLKWISNSLNHGMLRFDVVHNAMSDSDASREWIKRHFHIIPPDIRPAEAHIDEFSHLFASYLTISFELIKTTHLKIHCGCNCNICAFLISSGYLLPRKVTRNARKNAVELKRFCLTSIAEDSGLALLDAEIDHLMKNIDIREKISLVTYFSELVRRTQFAGQGEAILVLWREIAWEGTAPKKGFKLKTDDIMNAEMIILNKMKYIVSMS